jgi:glycosyltransferase involved in cell wall biosynthesis
MRIGMILDKTFPPDPRVENEASALIANGHEVILFCLRYDNHSASEIYNEIQVKRYLSNKLEYKLSALAYTFPFYSNSMSKKIAHFLDENKIECIHIHDMVVAQAVFKANKKSNLPVVLDLHENRPEIMKFYPHLQKFPGKQLISTSKWKSKEEEFIYKADKVIVVTEEANKQIKKRLKRVKKKIVVVPNTVTRSFYSNVKLHKDILNKYKNKFVILYIGDTGLRRGLQTAIGSLIEIKSQIKGLSNYKREIKLVIVGENSTDNVLKEQVKKLNLTKHVDFEGWKDMELFPSYIQAASICISPLFRNIHHDTTYANKLFQYMSFGKPLLVSDAKAQKNLVLKTKCGLIHQEKNALDFAKKVLELYSDPVKQKKMGEGGKRFVENEFVWEKVSSGLVDLYKNIEAGS